MNRGKYPRRCGKLIVIFSLSLALRAAAADESSPKQVLSGPDGAAISISLGKDNLEIEYDAPGIDWNRTVYVAFGTNNDIGSAVIPFGEKTEGSTVFLPFKADRLFEFEMDNNRLISRRRDWKKWAWTNSTDAKAVDAEVGASNCTLRIPFSELGNAKKVDLAFYSKIFTSNPWGRLFGCSDAAVLAGTGDKYIPHYLELNLAATDDKIATVRSRLGGTKLRIYQLLVRLFGNTNETRKRDGTLADNGAGKFNDINDNALKSLRDSGFSHIWLTGVLQQATATDYSSMGQPADDPDLLKGIAGSPYAIKDYFDVCPDYAVKPEQRLDEFKALLQRIHKNGLKALIDFVPNHVARSYNSDVKPEVNFGTKGNDGAGDDVSVFFSPRNNFFYLRPDSAGPPVHLPTIKDGQPVSPTCKALSDIGGTTSVSSQNLGRESARPSNCDGLFDAEKDHGKVTGNNVASWTPSINDWYETVKLNYGFDFTKNDKSVREYPNANAPDKTIPDTWRKMDRVLQYWQAMGVDGFRCDMSHMVPPEFWNWAIAKARGRNPDVVFIAEAYDNDPAKVSGADPIISKLNGGKSNVMFDLLNAGFNAVYDDPTYRAIKKIYEGSAWANDIDDARPDDFIFDNSLRYGENHDEVRLAAKSQWGGIGMKVGIPVSAILYGLSRGPVMLYHGQEVGEPAEGVEGFGGDDARTSIFDYWSMPEFVKWVNDHKYDGGRLSDQQKQLRLFYGRLITLMNEAAFRDGACIPLNAANRDNSSYGRAGNDQASGHWFYSFMRYDHSTGQRFVVAVNLSPSIALTDIAIRISDTTLAAAALNRADRQSRVRVLDRLNAPPLTDVSLTLGYLKETGIPIAEIPPLTACYLEIKL